MSERESLELSNTALERSANEHAKAQRTSEAKLRAIVETSIDGIITMDLHGNLMSFNPAAEKIFGYEADDVIGTNLTMLMPEDTREDQGLKLRDFMQEFQDQNAS